MTKLKINIHTQLAYTKEKSIENRKVLFLSAVMSVILRKMSQIIPSCIIIINQQQNIAQAKIRNIV